MVLTEPKICRAAVRQSHSVSRTNQHGCGLIDDMSETAWLKRRWKLIVNVLTVVALVVLVFAVRHQLAATVDEFSSVNILALLLLVPIEWANYDAQARLYHGLFWLVGNRLSYRFLFETSLELNFINNVFPSGGVSGISYFGVRMRGDDI